MVELAPWLMVLVTVYLMTPLVVYMAIPYVFYGGRSGKKTIAIYVLGEVGHSPRMCYHALSFAQRGWQVELCGVVDSIEVPQDLAKNDNITVHRLPVYCGPKNSLLGMITKVVFQIWVITQQLWQLRGTSYILVQNPPSIPILPLIVLFKVFLRSKLIIDWHNLAYSILQLKLNTSFYDPLVLISFAVEYLCSKFANYHLTVTRAMQDYIVHSFGVTKSSTVVLYDRPPAKFTPLQLTSKERANLLKTEPFIKNYVPDGFDILQGDKIIVTSTSFTPDEDIGILLGALKIYENSFKKFDNSLPQILCFITGKGPLKETYLKQVQDFSWNRCHVEFVWLSAEDYPRLLRLCDFGVSLHTSSSGLDLPMKILDMFGSGLPVIAMNYPVLDELLTHNVNGLKFGDRRELHESLIFAAKDPKVATHLKNNVLNEVKKRWDPTWEKAMKQLDIL